MDKKHYERIVKKLYNDYQRASEISGLSIKELYSEDGKCLALVTDTNSKYYRMIGIVENHLQKFILHSINYFRGGDKCVLATQILFDRKN